MNARSARHHDDAPPHQLTTLLARLHPGKEGSFVHAQVRLKIHGRLTGRNSNSCHWRKIGALAAAGVWTMRRLGRYIVTATTPPRTRLRRNLYPLRHTRGPILENTPWFVNGTAP